MIKWWKLSLLFIPLFFLRLAFGLWVEPVQPRYDEIQTYLLGLKYFATGLWPYYGNEFSMWHEGRKLLMQDPGALEALLVGLPLKIWPSPLSPYVLLNLIALAGHAFLAWYACKRLPKLPPWFIFTWVLTAPWFLHYSTTMNNMSYSIAAADVFFVAFLETLPALSLGWISLPWANALMGFSLSGWVQIHRTWVLVAPLVLFSFFLQSKTNRLWPAIVYFLVGALPLSLLVLPTLFQPDYHLVREAWGLSFSLNIHNFLMFFALLAQFLALACFETARFIGENTMDRVQYLVQNVFLWPGFLLWIFGYVQMFLLAASLIVRKSSHRDWAGMRLFLASVFLLVYGSLCCTAKSPDVNTYCEMMPVVMLYSLYIWERGWEIQWGKPILVFLLLCGLVFQTAYIFIELPKDKSLYLMTRDKMTQAIEKHDYQILGVRRRE